MKVTFVKTDDCFLRGVAKLVSDDRFEVNYLVKPLVAGEEGGSFQIAGDLLYLKDCLWDGAVVNVSRDRIIIEPDKLIDISAIASCFTEVGPNALNYIYNLVFPSPPSAYNLLGNTVNLFFDDKVKGSSRTYQETLQQTFHDDAIQFLAVDEDMLKQVYFKTIAQHYQNVTQTVEGDFARQNPPLRKENGMIEPSFICQELGISGRMDYLELHDEGASIIELKSGKKDEFRKTSKISHLIQTLLYCEALHFSQKIPYEQIHPYLLYNKYPELSREAYSRQLVNRALRVRNEIVGLLHKITEGKGERLFTTEAVEGMYQTQSKLWHLYTKPDLLAKVTVISEARETMKKWFFSQLQFILKEEELSRLDREEESERLAPLSLKETLTNDDGEITGFRLGIRLDDEFSSHDFRKGDAVIFYPLDTLETRAEEKIIMHANIAAIEDTEMTIELRVNERRGSFERMGTKTFACEHDTINSNAAHACRAAYRMLLADEKWQRLLIEGEKAENGEYRLIVGPPGTGKTSVYLRRLITDIYNNTRENILLLAFTHRAVDEICKTLEDIIAEDNAFLTYCRLGSSYNCGEKKYSNRILAKFIADCKRRSELQAKINDTRIFVATTSRMNITHSLFDIKKFDTIIVDESSQLLEYQYIELLTHAKRFILIGDHRQLPAVTLQAENRSLFERLYEENREANPEVVGKLSRQGRMHPEIAKFANQMFYNNQLDIIPLPHQLETTAALPRYRFIDVKPSEDELFTFHSKKCNPTEARAVADVVEEVIAKLSGEEITGKTIGIIVPYRNQISAIRKELSRKSIAEKSQLINIDTVERYQGSQRDVIIFSATVTTSQQLKKLAAPIWIDGQLVDRKLNVIITRARKHLYIIGNETLLSENTVYSELIEKMKEK